MEFLRKLERKIDRSIPQQITNILLVGQVFSYVLVYKQPGFAQYFYFNGFLLTHGQWWRLGTFLFAPVADSLLFAALAYYFFYMLGNALERQWGSYTYLKYIALSYLGCVIYALLFPDQYVSNIYLYTSLFLAFAFLNPNFRVLLFFILPIKMKWLGIIAWAGLLLAFITSPFPNQILLALSLSNFVIFFYRDLTFLHATSMRKSIQNSKTKFTKAVPNHICAICGQNEIDNPDMEIRYCSRCNPTTCYCGTHIGKHQHKRMIN